MDGNNVKRDIESNKIELCHSLKKWENGNFTQVEKPKKVGSTECD